MGVTFSLSGLQLKTFVYLTKKKKLSSPARGRHFVRSINYGYLNVAFNIIKYLNLTIRSLQKALDYNYQCRQIDENYIEYVMSLMKYEINKL